MSIHRAGDDRSGPSGSDGARRAAEWREHEPCDGPDAARARLAVIRHRIDRGFYDEPAVASQVARLLLASGDLTRPRPTP